MHVNAAAALQATATAAAMANNARYAAYKYILKHSHDHDHDHTHGQCGCGMQFLRRLCLCCAQHIADASFLLPRCTANRIVAITRHIGERGELVIARVCVLSRSFVSILLCVSSHFVVVFCSFTRK